MFGRSPMGQRTFLKEAPFQAFKEEHFTISPPQRPRPIAHDLSPRPQQQPWAAGPLAFSSSSSDEMPPTYVGPTPPPPDLQPPSQQQHQHAPAEYMPSWYQTPWRQLQRQPLGSGAEAALSPHRAGDGPSDLRQRLRQHGPGAAVGPTHSLESLTLVRSSRQPASDLHLSQLVNGQANRFGKRAIMNEYATPPLKEQLRRYPS